MPDPHSAPSKRCPCGGRAWSLAEIQAQVRTDCIPPAAEQWCAYWESVLGPEDFYCSDEDDVLLRGEAKPRA